MKKNIFSQVKWKIVAPLLVAIALCVYLIIAMAISLSDPSKTINIKPIKDLSSKETYQIYKNENRENPVEFKDYFFYGESFDLYLDTYQLGQDDAITGKTIRFVDLSKKDAQPIEFVINSELDNQVDLTKLPEGFYSVYLVDDQTVSRLYYSEITSFSINTVTRNNMRNEVCFYCDKEYFCTVDDKDLVLDYNYLYVDVTSKEVNESIEQYDIVISTDPAIVGSMDPKGYSMNGIVEAQELYDVAQILKSNLEAAGFKVLILKDSFNQKINFYGEKGVLEKAYTSRAKYMIHLDLEEPAVNGKESLPFVRFSSYSSGKFADSVMEVLQTADFTTTTATRSKIDKEIYDYTYEIREAGGKALKAGSYSASAQTNTFAIDNQYGINTIEVSYGNIYSANQMTTFKNNKESWALATAQGIISYLK